MTPSATFSPLIFINYLVPSRLLEPLIPPPLLLDTVSHRGDSFAYLSVVLLRYTRFEIGHLAFPIPWVAQMNYRAYVRFFGKKALYFFHSFVGRLPRRLLQSSQLPLGPLRIETKIQENPDGSFRALSVQGRAGDSALDLQLADVPSNLFAADRQRIDDLTGRGLGIFQKNDGVFVYVNVSHPPMVVQPAMVVALDLPKVRELPFFTGGREYLSSVWLVRASQFSFHIGTSMILRTLDRWARRRRGIRTSS